MNHDLEPHGRYAWRCQRCGQIWSLSTSKPVSSCPDLKMYAEHDRHPLMTKTELAQAGYRTETLPAPIACFVNTSHRLMPLYDPAQVQKRQRSKRVRTQLYVSQLHWPRSLSLLLEPDSLAQENWSWFGSVSWYHMPLYQASSIANAAAHLAFFDPQEIQQAAGETLLLTFPLTLIRHTYSSIRIDDAERLRLVKRILLAYERLKKSYVEK